MDRLNTKYGKGTVSVGGLLEQNQVGAQTRISFSRVPDLEEF